MQNVRYNNNGMANLTPSCWIERILLVKQRLTSNENPFENKFAERLSASKPLRPILKKGVTIFILGGRGCELHG